MPNPLCECPVAGFCQRHQIEKTPHLHKLCQGVAPTSCGGWKYWVAWEKGMLGATAPPMPVVDPPPFVVRDRSYVTTPTGGKQIVIDGVPQKCCGGAKEGRTWEDVAAELQAAKGGPGSELLKIYKAAGVPTCPACVAMAIQMNQWGPADCAAKVDEIVADMLPRAKIWVAENRPFIHALLPGLVEDVGIRWKIRSDVLAAIAAAEGTK